MDGSGFANPNLLRAPPKKDGMYKEEGISGGCSGAQYMHQGPEAIRVFSFGCGALTVVFGIIWLIKISLIIENPVKYLQGFLDVPFGVIIMSLEASSNWTAKIKFFAVVQDWFHQYFKALTYLWGRAFFYIYVGAHVIYLDGLVSVGAILGFVLVVIGLLMLAAFRGYDVEKPAEEVLERLKSYSSLVGSFRAGGTPQPAGQVEGEDYVRLGP